MFVFIKMLHRESFFEYLVYIKKPKLITLKNSQLSLKTFLINLINRIKDSNSNKQGPLSQVTKEMILRIKDLWDKKNSVSKYENL